MRLNQADRRTTRSTAAWRRLTSGGVVGAAILATIGLSAPVEAQTVTPLPNVVVIVVDDMNATDFTRETMPNVFRYIVDRGTSFDNYITSSPLCGPARATMLTGAYAHNHGVRFCLDAAGTDFQKFDAYLRRGYADNDMGAEFQARGYYTAMVGKYVNSYGLASVMLNSFRVRGYDNYVPHGWNQMFVPLDAAYFEYTAIRNGTRLLYGSRQRDFRTDVEVRESIGAVRSAVVAQKPFLLHFWPLGPHQASAGSPLIEYPSRHSTFAPTAVLERTPDLNEADMSDKPAILQQVALLPAARFNVYDDLHRRRLRSLQSVDEGVGELVTYLKMNRQFDNTYFVFVSDNGMSFGNHRLTAKMNPYEQTINVPLVIAGPGIVAGRTRTELVGAADLHPTIQELVTGTVPAVDGQSLVRLLRSSVPTEPWRSEILVEHWASANQYAGPGLVVSVPFDYRAIRRRDSVFIKWYSGEVEYYDLVADPYQLQNIAGRLAPEVLAGLHARVDALATCQLQACWDYGMTPPAVVPVARLNVAGSGRKPPVVDAVVAANPVIVVTEPAIGATLRRGTTVTVRWSTSSMLSTDNVAIWLESRDNPPVILTAAARNTGTYSKQIPSNTSPGAYRLVIRSNRTPSLANESRALRITV